MEHTPEKPVKREGIVRAFLRKSNRKTLTCRICLEQDFRIQMISPCSCKGTSEFVHKACLSKWRSIDGASRFRCEICHSHYQFCRSWLKAGNAKFAALSSSTNTHPPPSIIGLIRLGCWSAILVYGYFMLCIIQWCICWFGLVPSTSRSRVFGFTHEILSPYIDLWFENVTIGPTSLLVSTCVCLKKNRNGISVFLKLIAAWAITYYLSFLSMHIALVSDLFYMSLATFGMLRTLRHSFTTAQVVAPAIAVVLVDLSIHERS